MKDPFAARKRLRLKPLQVPGFEQPIDLIEGRLTIGRSPDNDLTLPGDVFPSVSTHHALLEVIEPGRLRLQDLGSRNGTLVNGEAVQEAQLVLGDVLQLGAIGPRFVVISSAPLSETMFVDPSAAGVGEKISEERVREMVTRRTRRTSGLLVALGVVAIGALVWWGLDIAAQDKDRAAGLAETLARQEVAQVAEVTRALELTEELRRESAARELRWAELERVRTLHVENLQASITAGEAAAKGLRERLAQLEESGAASSEVERLEASLARTREELETARDQFSRFDPVNLEAARLSDISRVREAVVLIESSLALVNEDGVELHVDPVLGPNFDGEGVPWLMESTGSGFCVSPEGWIVTNAHVVQPGEDVRLIPAGRLSSIETRLELNAVFTGSAERRSLTVVRTAEDGVDLALARVEPFEGMPYVRDFSTVAPVVDPGSDVFLFGFPLGNFALQEGRTVIASTFRGILSRVVGGHLQVDAGVHPGNSGGPITDLRGRVIGVVFSVQATPDRQAVYTIGYGIPISAAQAVWPPPADWSPEEEEESSETEGAAAEDGDDSTPE